MSDFFKDIIKTTGNEYAALASDGIEGADVAFMFPGGTTSV